jgi:hypothetical protein
VGAVPERLQTSDFLSLPALWPVESIDLKKARHTTLKQLSVASN